MTARPAPIVRLLQTSNLPILYMLRIEEALLRATQENWLFVNDGTRDPAVVLGISGKPQELVHVKEAQRARIPLIKRFSGGGTVIVDRNTVFSTLVFGTQSLPDVQPFPGNIMQYAAEVCKFPAAAWRSGCVLRSPRACILPVRQN